MVGGSPVTAGEWRSRAVAVTTGIPNRWGRDKLGQTGDRLTSCGFATGRAVPRDGGRRL